MKNEFVSKYDGKKIFCEFAGGQSRNGDYAVDYELVRIGDVELYAETLPNDDSDKSFEILSAEIQRQAEEKGIDLDIYNPIFD